MMNAFANYTKSVQQAATRAGFYAKTSLGRMAYQEFWTTASNNKHYLGREQSYFLTYCVEAQHLALTLDGENKYK